MRRRLFAQALSWYCRRLPPHRGMYRIVRTLARGCADQPVMSRYGVKLTCRPNDLTFHYAMLGQYGQVGDELVTRLKSGMCFIDAGAYVGDSSLAFMEYSPATIYAFEPSRSNRDIFSKLMAENQIQDDRIVLVNKGLADHKGVTTFSENTSGTSLREAGSCRVELITLDDFVKENKLPPVGLIKADVEGMGLALLKGALETIKRDKPVLSLCIYHNKEEFLGTYDLLRNQNLPYDYKVVSLCMPWENNELVLLGLPRL